MNDSSDELPGFRRIRRDLLGEAPDRVDGVARLGYGMGGPKGPFDAPPEEPIELDADELPWELRDGA
ncbi:hypothetical protein [Salinibacterium sp. ZJ77]|uniref:hypothetical protein n=1 Tax=Salinibacterium sp. ZJ77 TaxID=2708337 RepID=UPI00141E8677|nr:hypothetical protein [Salinibacterium sp. ZJ77]